MFYFDFLSKCRSAGVNPHKRKQKRKRVCTESLETEMYGTHSFIQKLKWSSMSRIAIYHINKMVTPQAVGINYLKTKEQRNHLMTLVFMTSGFMTSVCIYFLKTMDVFFIKKRSFVKPQMLRLRPKDEKISSSQSILSLKK